MGSALSPRALREPMMQRSFQPLLEAFESAFTLPPTHLEAASHGLNERSPSGSINVQR
jgi:hypothetical protein